MSRISGQGMVIANGVSVSDQLGKKKLLEALEYLLPLAPTLMSSIFFLCSCKSRQDSRRRCEQENFEFWDVPSGESHKFLQYGFGTRM
ncbi:unnamed protein product [Brassica oleracea]|uniref:(rape) hypothetical protein n=1 Tax=Brassica napus TaxID=3708 RepID=A0A816Q665_BRANA|nr:unnamed protein product [Brassica napus]